MALVRAYEDDDYRPEYSLLVLVDPSVDWPAEDPEVPRYRDRGDRPTGSFAGSGAGWITCQASGEADHDVRLELHDAAPPDDRALFEDVLETPYRSSSGGLTLTTLTGGAGMPDLDLGDPEWFRVRIARRRDDTEEFPLDRWLLRLWPEPNLEPPVWLARHGRPSPRSLTEDVEAVLRWTPRPSLEITATDLAGRLLISETVLPETLAAAEKKKLLHADETGEALRLTPGPRPGTDQAATPSPSSRSTTDPTPPASPGSPAGRRPTPEEVMAALEAALTAEGHEHLTDAGLAEGVVFGITVLSSGPQRPAPPPGPPFGPPPRAGIVETDGTVVVWRDGARVELANIGRTDQPHAWETALGVLVAAWGQPARLVSPDGVVTEFEGPVNRVTVLGDGRRVAMLDMHHHRRKSRYLLRVLDLADGSLEPMPWPEDQEISVLGAHRDTIYFRHTPDPGTPGIDMRWTLGTDPEPHGRPVLHVDPVSGATCAPTADGARIDHPGGTTVRVPLAPWSRAHLAPGGDRLWQRPDPSPPEFHLFPVGEQARVWKLPREGHSYGPPVWAGTVWEDTDTVLIGHGSGHVPREPSCGIRIRTVTGTIERLPPAGAHSRLATLVTPLLTR